jgi:hypothetical protein
VGFVFRGGVPRRDNKLLADGLAFLDFFLCNRAEIDDEVTDVFGKYFATVALGKQFRYFKK